jgi:hypothetical protein
MAIVFRRKGRLLDDILADQINGGIAYSRRGVGQPIFQCLLDEWLNISLRYGTFNVP